MALFRLFSQALPLCESTKHGITSPFEPCRTLKSRHGALHHRTALCVLSRYYFPLCLPAHCRVSVYLFVSLPLEYLTPYIFSRSPTSKDGTGSAFTLLSALAALSHLVGLALSHHGAFRSQISGHRTCHLSPYRSLFLWTAITLSLSLAPPDSLHALTIPCCCSFR